MPHFVLGIDVGQSPDATAAALIEYEHSRQPDYALRALYQFPRGTPYSELAEPIGQRIDQAPLKGHINLALDASGPGGPVRDYLREQLHPTPIFAITITGGTDVTGDTRNPRVPKRDLISTTSLILEQRRLRIAANMKDTEAHLDELLSYRRTTNERGYDTYSAPSGSHDDLVLALSLALWTAENRNPATHRHQTTTPARLRLPTIDVPRRAGSLYQWPI